MSTTFETESGSIYEVDKGYIRRVNEGHVKRADGEWLTLMQPLDLVIGFPAWIVTNSLNDYGSDDFGESVIATDYTTRVTTPVVAVYGK